MCLSRMSRKVPSAFVCSITCDVMDDPVVAEDGHSYERASLQRWFQSRATSPLTNEPLRSTTIRSNIALRHAIEEWRQLRPKRVFRVSDSLQLERLEREKEALQRGLAEAECTIEQLGHSLEQFQRQLEAAAREQEASRRDFKQLQRKLLLSNAKLETAQRHEAEAQERMRELRCARDEGLARAEAQSRRVAELKEQVVEAFGAVGMRMDMPFVELVNEPADCTKAAGSNSRGSKKNKKNGRGSLPAEWLTEAGMVHVRWVCVAYRLHACCMCVVCMLHMRCMCAACMLHMRCMHAVCMLHLCCMYVACGLNVRCMCA